MQGIMLYLEQFNLTCKAQCHQFQLGRTSIAPKMTVCNLRSHVICHLLNLNACSPLSSSSSTPDMSCDQCETQFPLHKQVLGLCIEMSKEDVCSVIVQLVWCLLHCIDSFMSVTRLLVQNLAVPTFCAEYLTHITTQLVKILFCLGYTCFQADILHFCFHVAISMQSSVSIGV